MKLPKTKDLSRKILTSAMLLLIVSCGGGGGGSTPNQAQSDTTPDPFVFTDQSDIQYATQVQSGSITISGIDAASSISVTGGEYSIDGGSFVSTNGTVTNGQSIIVQQTSASTSKTVTDTVLTIGGISDTFSVTTVLVLNVDFVEKTEIVTINGINLFEGNVNINDATINPLDVGNLNSGDLLTVDIEFDISALLVNDFVFSVQLMPQSVVSQFGTGSTLGEILTQDFVANDGEEIIDLGGVYIELDSIGTKHAVLHAKLPALSQDIDYRVMVTPDISFLASGQSTQREELALMPVFIKDEILSIKKLESTIVQVIEPPVLLDNNDFTHLDVATIFESNGFSRRPIFQTFIEVDVTSFNQSEMVELSMSWTASDGSIFPLGLAGVDQAGNPTITENPTFEVTRDGGKSIQLPVVAYLNEAVHTEMLASSTSIRDIADTTPETANFKLDINVIEGGVSNNMPTSFNFTLPLVSQDLSATLQSDSDIINFTALRAGQTNSACLTIQTDIETGFILVDSETTITADNCGDTSKQLWRYDHQTEQIIAKITDEVGNNYCIDVIFENLSGPESYLLARCKFDPSIAEIGHFEQRFLFENGKPIEWVAAPFYLSVNFSSIQPQSVTIASEFENAPNFFSDSNGIDIDRNGRLFYVGDNSEYSFGDLDFAYAGITYGGKSYVDYKPVAGIVAYGDASLSVGLFGTSLDIMSVSFEYQKHLSKQLTSVSGNISPVDIKNGKEAIFTLLGVEVRRGEMKIDTITESYNPLENLATFLTEEQDPEEIGSIDFGNGDYDQELFNVTYIIYGIPVVISGRLEGALTLKGFLNELQPFGLDANLESRMFLEATLSASVDAFIASAGIEASVLVVDKTFSFNATGQFTANDNFELLSPEIRFVTDVDLNLDIEVLKGKIEAFVEYPRVCVCLAFGETVRKEITLFESKSLFSYHNNFINGSVPDLVFKL